MNARGAEALVDAAMKGVRQIKGQYHDGAGGHCAMGVLERNFPLCTLDVVALGRDPLHCSVCDMLYPDEFYLIIHLNDVHEWDFLTIARKLGPA